MVAKQVKIYKGAPRGRQCMAMFTAMNQYGNRCKLYCERYKGHNGPCQVPHQERLTSGRGDFTEWNPLSPPAQSKSAPSPDTAAPASKAPVPDYKPGDWVRSKDGTIYGVVTQCKCGCGRFILFNPESGTVLKSSDELSPSPSPAGVPASKPPVGMPSASEAYKGTLADTSLGPVVFPRVDEYNGPKAPEPPVPEKPEIYEPGGLFYEQCQVDFAGKNSLGMDTHWSCQRRKGHAGPHQWPSAERNKQMYPYVFSKGVYTEQTPVPGPDAVVKRVEPPSDLKDEMARIHGQVPNTAALGMMRLIGDMHGGGLLPQGEFIHISVRNGKASLISNMKPDDILPTLLGGIESLPPKVAEAAPAKSVVEPERPERIEVQNVKAEKCTHCHRPVLFGPRRFKLCLDCVIELLLGSRVLIYGADYKSRSPIFEIKFS